MEGKNVATGISVRSNIVQNTRERSVVERLVCIVQNKLEQCFRRKTYVPPPPAPTTPTILNRDIVKIDCIYNKRNIPICKFGQNWVLREITWPVNDTKTWPTKIAYQLTVNVIA